MSTATDDKKSEAQEPRAQSVDEIVRLYITNNGVIVTDTENKILFASEHASVLPYDEQYRLTIHSPGRTLGEYTKKLFERGHLVQIRPTRGSGLTERIDKTYTICRVLEVTKAQYYVMNGQLTDANRRRGHVARTIQQERQPKIDSLQAQIQQIEKQVETEIRALPQPQLEDYLPK